jgi:hypothetical protein
VEQLVFLARGPAPYRLAWGQDTAAVSLPLHELMPGRQPGDPLPTAAATVAPPAAPLAAAATPPSAPTSAASPPDTGHRKLWLWAALAAALALMGAMARALLKKPAATEA